MEIKTIKRRFLMVSLAFMISAASVVLVPFSIDKEGNLNRAGYAAGGMFWAGLVAGTAGYVCLLRKWKNECAEPTPGEPLKKGPPPGLAFFSNPPAKAADIILAAAAVGTICSAGNIAANPFVATVSLALTILGIYAHILFNGKAYQYICNYDGKKSE